MIRPQQSDPWYRRAVLYQIYPLSWADNNGDGYGDLRGIIEHLDYLQDGTAASLGVGAIWLSPIYRSGWADWGYDVIDHCAVDPRMGTMADFDELLAKAHERGMKVLLDFVANHTSVEHAWFREARSSRDSKHRDWYVWADGRDGGELPNNWQSHFGGPAWTLDKTTGQYYLHSFLPDQPDLNWRNPEVRSAMAEVMKFWLRRGVDGFRADAVTNLVKDEALRDDPPNPAYRPGLSLRQDVNLRVYSEQSEAIGELLGTFCEVLAEFPDRYMVSETYLNVAGLHKLYRACVQHPVHAPFNFNLMTLDWSAAAYQGFIDEYEAALGPDDWPNYVLGNHDQPRLVERVGVERARLLALLQLTLRGLPVIYYGDELGAENAVINTTNGRDKATMQDQAGAFWRDEARAVMAWSNERGAGFSEADPWLPAARNAATANVEAEERDPESFLHLYRHLFHLRAQLPALIEGEYRSLPVGNGAVFAYVREVERMRCYVVLNFSDEPQVVRLQQVGRWVAGTHLVDGDGEPHMGQTIELAPYEGRLYELRRGDAACM